jgi:hypothetical protein
LSANILNGYVLTTGTTVARMGVTPALPRKPTQARIMSCIFRESPGNKDAHFYMMTASDLVPAQEFRKLLALVRRTLTDIFE